MKKITLSILLAFLFNFSFGQVVLNPSLETWQNNTETNTTFLVAQHWLGDDVFITYLNEQFGNPTYSIHTVFRANGGHTGSYAAQMTVGVSNMGDTLGGLIYYADSASTLFANSLPGGKTPGFPFTSRPANLTGFYKWTRASGDTARIYIVMTKWNTSTQSRDTLVDVENYYITTNAASWTQFTVPLTYALNIYPDTVFMAAGIANTMTQSHVGSMFYVDDFAFTGTVPIGINEQANDQPSASVFPNPFNQEATLRVNNVQITNGTLEIYDVLGNKVRVMENLSGNNFVINREGLKSGIYFYNLISESEVVVMGKMSVE